MAVLSPSMIHVLYGEHWAPAAEALRFLAFVMVARMFTALVFDVQTGLGNTRVTVWLNLAWLVALLPALWLGAHAGGMRGAAGAHAVVAVVVAIPLAGWMLHRSGVDMRPVIRRTARPVLAAVVAGAVMALVARAAGRAVRPAGGGRRAGDRRLRADRAAAERVGDRAATGDVVPGGPSGHDMSGTSSSALVSIALPVYNGGPGLARVIESVLAQSHAHLELVISDNASTDETQEICRRLARTGPTCGLPAARHEHRPAQQLRRARRSAPAVPTCGGSGTTTRSSPSTSSGLSTRSPRTSAGSW